MHQRVRKDSLVVVEVGGVRWEEENTPTSPYGLVGGG